MTDRVCMRLSGRMLESFIGRALQEGVRFNSIERAGAREMRLTATEGNARILLRLAEEYGMDLSVIGEDGWPRFKRRFMERNTLALGLVLGFMLLTMFTSRIWRVEAVSLDGMAAGTLLDALEQSAGEMGVRPGKLARSIDRDALALAIHAQWPELTHVSVRISGVFLRLEVAMEETAPEVYDISAGRDLVAARDAIIVYVEPLSGKANVKAGDTVRRGQVLIRGEERIDTETTRGIRALGKVIGRVWFTADYELPTTEVLKNFTGETRVSAQVRLGEWSWPLSQAEDFACQEAETELLPIGGMYLPLRIERTIRREAEETRVPLDLERLKEAAAAQALSMARGQMPEGAQETDCWVDFAEQDGLLVARAAVEAEMDIAAERAEIMD